MSPNKILIVEDEDMLRKLYSSFLINKNLNGAYEVTAVSCAEEAISFSRRIIFSLIDRTL